MSGACTVDPCPTDVDEVAHEADPTPTPSSEVPSPEPGLRDDGVLDDTGRQSHDAATGSRGTLPSAEQRSD